jgi:hypothetical protein
MKLCSACQRKISSITTDTARRPNPRLPSATRQGRRALDGGNKDKKMQGVHQSIPYSAAGAPEQRRASVFRKTLIRAAQHVSRSQLLDNKSKSAVSLSTAAARLAAALLKSAERSRFRSTKKASARGRRVS